MTDDSSTKQGDRACVQAANEGRAKSHLEPEQGGKDEGDWRERNCTNQALQYSMNTLSTLSWAQLPWSPAFGASNRSIHTRMGLTVFFDPHGPLAYHCQ